MSCGRSIPVLIAVIVCLSSVKLLLADDVNTDFVEKGKHNQQPEGPDQGKRGKYIHHGESYGINLEGQFINGDVEISWFNKNFKEDKMTSNDDVFSAADNQTNVTTMKSTGEKKSDNSSNNGSRMSQPINDIVIFCIRNIELLLKFTSGICIN